MIQYNSLRRISVKFRFFYLQGEIIQQYQFLFFHPRILYRYTEIYRVPIQGMKYGRKYGAGEQGVDSDGALPLHSRAHAFTVSLLLGSNEQLACEPAVSTLIVSSSRTLSCVKKSKISHFSHLPCVTTKLNRKIYVSNNLIIQIHILIFIPVHY